jgi:hypothetical protein
MRVLKKFLEYILKSRLLRSSEMLINFLTIENYGDFIEFKKGVAKIRQPLNLYEYSNLEGLIQLRITPEDIGKAGMIRKNVTCHEILLKKLKFALNNLNSSFETLSKSLKEVSNIFELLSEASEKTGEVNFK